MLSNSPNSAEILTKLLVCPLCNALCKNVSNKEFETICAACGKTFSSIDANTIIVTDEHLLKNYQKLTKDIWTAYIENQ